jgi:hypothetical protein
MLGLAVCRAQVDPLPRVGVRSSSTFLHQFRGRNATACLGEALSGDGSRGVQSI